jgi:hypothetical protein
VALRVRLREHGGAHGGGTSAFPEERAALQDAVLPGLRAALADAGVRVTWQVEGPASGLDRGAPAAELRAPGERQLALELHLACAGKPPPPPPRTKWTRRVPQPVLIGHAAPLAPY